MLKLIGHDYKKLMFACDLNERATTQFILIGTSEGFLDLKYALLLCTFQILFLL